MIVIALSRFLLLVGKVMEKLSLILLKEYVSICKLKCFFNQTLWLLFLLLFVLVRLLIEGSYYLRAAFFFVGKPMASNNGRIRSMWVI